MAQQVDFSDGRGGVQPENLNTGGSDLTGAVIRAQERAARERAANTGAQTIAPQQTEKPGAGNVAEALRIQGKREAAAAAKAARQAARQAANEAPSKPPKTSPTGVASPAQKRARQKVDAGRSSASAKGDIREFVRPATAGAVFDRKSARLGAFDPRQRTQGEKRRAVDALNAPGQTTSRVNPVAAPVAVQSPGPITALPSGGFNPKQFEEEQRLLGVATG